MINNLQIGNYAPNFVSIGVYKQKLGKIRLSDYRGKKYVVLIFYPANFTPISPNELLAINNRIADFQKLSAQVLAISVDSPFSHLQWLTSFKNQNDIVDLHYPLISDLRQTIANDYKLLTYDGLALPGLFIIDKEGMIQYYTVNNLLCYRNINEILRILKSLHYIKENHEQLNDNVWDQETSLTKSKVSY